MTFPFDGGAEFGAESDSRDEAGAPASMQKIQMMTRIEPAIVSPLENASHARITVRVQRAQRRSDRWSRSPNNRCHRQVISTQTRAKTWLNVMMMGWFMISFVPKRWRGAIILIILIGIGATIGSPIQFSETDVASDAAADRVEARAEVDAVPATMMTFVRADAMPSLVDQLCEQGDERANVAIGDRIQVRIFELGASATGDGRAEAVLERLDLSTEIVVDVSGGATLPGLGRFGISERSPGCLSQEVAERFGQVFGGAAQVTAEFTARQPVFVTGAVAAPGSYEISPGMAVMHVLALSGGGSVANSAGSSARAELATRRLQIERRKAGIELEIARLAAEAEQKTRLQLSDSARAAIERALGADRIDSERALLEASVGAARFEQADAEAALADARAMESAAKRRLDLLLEQVERHRHDNDSLTALNQRGVAPSSRVEEVAQRLMQSERRREEADLAYLAAQQARRSTEAKLARLSMDHRLGLAARMRDLRAELNGLDAESEGQDAMLLLAGGARNSGDAVYELMRQTSDGLRAVAADETTLLRPGDLLKVLAPSGA